jgi:hypothetical protein
MKAIVTLKWRMAAVCGLSAYLSTAAWAGSTPPAIGPANSTSGSGAAESIQAPATPVVPGLTLVNTPAPVRVAPVIDAGDRGCEFTDGGFGLPAAAPTAAEQVKLAMAREAVHAAYGAGTLPMQLDEDLGPALTEEEINAAKLRQLLQRMPGLPVIDPAAGLGISTAPVQAIGETGLNEIEKAKLDGQALPRPAPVAPAVPVTRKEAK